MKYEVWRESHTDRSPTKCGVYDDRVEAREAAVWDAEATA